MGKVYYVIIRYTNVCHYSKKNSLTLVLKYFINMPFYEKWLFKKLNKTWFSYFTPTLFPTLFRVFIHTVVLMPSVINCYVNNQENERKDIKCIRCVQTFVLVLSNCDASALAVDQETSTCFYFQEKRLYTSEVSPQ